MPSAILIAGGSKRHRDEVQRMSDFLIQNIGLHKGHTKIIEAAYLGEKGFTLRMKKELKKLKGQGPLLLYFAGHGDEKGYWCLNEDQKIPYETVGKFLKEWGEGVLFVNDDCFAYSAAGIFEKVGVDREKVGIIAASDAKTESFSRKLLDDLFPAWERKEVYAPKVVYRDTKVYGGIVRPFRDRDFIRTFHTRPRWKRIFDHLKYAALETWCLFCDVAADIIVRFFKKCYLGSAKAFGKEVFIEKDPDEENIEITVQESQRWGAVLDEHFFAKDKYQCG